MDNLNENINLYISRKFLIVSKSWKTILKHLEKMVYKQWVH
jgi:hypothetical protein